MCTINTNILYLTWRKDIDRKRYIIGVLCKDADRYTFSYKKENLEIAIKEDGFTCYPAFPDTKKTYTENVLEIFQRRLLNPQRSDYKDFLDYRGAIKYKNDTFAILGLTGAKLLTDNFEFIAPHNEIPANFNTDVSWLNIKSKDLIERIRPLSNLEVEQCLSLEPDFGNIYDKKAVKVLFRQELLGYIKSIHCANIYDAINKNRKVRVKLANIIKNGTIKEVLLRIEIA